MRNTALTVIPVPQLTDPPNVPLHLGQVADQLEAFALPRFATAAARATAWPSPPKGAHSVRLDFAWPAAGTPVVEVYTGTLWKPVAGTIVWDLLSPIPDSASAAVGLRDVYNFGPGQTYPYPVVAEHQVWGYAGFSGGQCAFYSDVFAISPNVSVAGTREQFAQGGSWAPIPMTAVYSVAANADVTSKWRLNVTNTGGGTTHTGGTAYMKVRAA